MEDSDNTKHHDGHKCAMCLWHYGEKHVLLRWILGLAILAIVFGIGLKIGEFKGGLEGGYYGSGFGRHGMMWGGDDGDNRFSNPNNYYYAG